MGPTRLLAGSHLYANLAGVVREQVFMRRMPPGSVVIADFDLGHAGAPNRTAMTRYMLKFVGLRLRNPTAATWDHRDPTWRTPSGLRTPRDLPQAWTSLWNWLRGAPRTLGIQARTGAEPGMLVAALDATDQGERLAALYDLVAMGDSAVQRSSRPCGHPLAATGTCRRRKPIPPFTARRATTGSVASATANSYPRTARLKRLATPSALMAAVDYLETYRWDPVHHRFWRAMVKARAAA